MKEKQPVVIIGGAGKMGAKTAELFRGLNHEVRVSDIQKGFPTPQEAVTGNEIVFFSIPPVEISKVTEAIKHNLTHVNQVLDNASVKDPLIDSFNMLDQNGISVCSTHPLCGPTVEWKGQRAIVINVGKHFRAAQLTAQSLYEKAGMHLEELTFGEHKNHMMLHQAVPHLEMRLKGLRIAELGFSFSDLEKYATANSNLYYQASMGRVWFQPSEISAEIIFDHSRTDGQKKVLKKFVNIPDDFPIDDKESMVKLFQMAETILFKSKKSTQDKVKAEMGRKTTQLIEAQKNIS